MNPVGGQVPGGGTRQVTISFKVHSWERSGNGFGRPGPRGPQFGPQFGPRGFEQRGEGDLGFVVEAEQDPVKNPPLKMAQAGLVLRELRREQTSLEDVFAKLTTREAEADDESSADDTGAPPADGEDRAEPSSAPQETP